MEKTLKIQKKISILLALIFAIEILLGGGIFFYEAADKLKIKARNEAVNITDTLKSSLEESHRKVDDIIKLGDLRNRGKHLSILEKYSSGHLFNLRDMSIYSIFGDTLNREETNLLKDSLRPTWVSARSPFQSYSYHTFLDDTYLIKYVIDFTTRDRFLLLLKTKKNYVDILLKKPRYSSNRRVTIISSSDRYLFGSRYLLAPLSPSINYSEYIYSGNFVVEKIDEDYSWRVGVIFIDIYHEIILSALRKLSIVSMVLVVIFLGGLFFLKNSIFKPIEGLMKFIEKNNDPEKELNSLLEIRESYEKSLPKIQERRVLEYLKGHSHKEIHSFFKDLSYHYLIIVTKESTASTGRFRDFIFKWKGLFKLIKEDNHIIIILKSPSRTSLLEVNKDLQEVNKGVISISNIKQGITELNMAYNEAFIAFNSSIISKEYLVEYHRLTPPKEEVHFPYEELKTILKDVLSNKKSEDNIVSIIDSIFLQNPPISTLRYFLVKLLMEINNFTRENNIKVPLKTIEDGHFQLSALQTRGEVNMFFIDNLKKAIEKIRDKSLEDDYKFILEVEKIIEKNYSYPNFTISILSEKLGYSISHIEKKFKKFHNISVKNYLINIRIQKAKAILQLEPSIKIKDLALEVGYDNSRSFTTIFKKYEGISPLNYKKSL